MDFNPRTATGIPTEPVGSIPRPLKLQQAYAAYDAKKVTRAQLEDEQNAAVADTLSRFEATGSPIITDGEQRVSSFATYPIAETLAGTGLAANLAPGGQYFAIFADGHNRQLPKITGGPFRYNFYAGELVKKTVKMTAKPLHQAVIAPSMMYLLYPLDGEAQGYSRRQLRRTSSTNARRTSVPALRPAPRTW
jgi:methionine synthase II (cobalamin-independent)